jgi:hypothetical protein
VRREYQPENHTDDEQTEVDELDVGGVWLHDDTPRKAMN